MTAALRTLIHGGDITPWASVHVTKPTEQQRERRHRVRGAGEWVNASRKAWWLEGLDGGFELEDIKRNRGRQSAPIRVNLQVTENPKEELMWTSATLQLDRVNTVVSRDVIALLRFLDTCAARPTSKEVASATGEHKLPDNRARAALTQARVKGWASAEDGSRNSKLWGITETGRARLLLAGWSQ